MRTAAATGNASQGKLESPLKLNFHAEVGSNFGEYRTGYDVLHGSNKSAGDVVITGKFTASRKGGYGGPDVVTTNPDACPHFKNSNTCSRLLPRTRPSFSSLST